LPGGFARGLQLGGEQLVPVGAEDSFGQEAGQAVEEVVFADRKMTGCPSGRYAFSARRRTN
jgi:hypothetical protein